MNGERLMLDALGGGDIYGLLHARVVTGQDVEAGVQDWSTESQFVIVSLTMSRGVTLILCKCRSQQ